MDDATTELTERFERYCDTKEHVLPSDVLSELHSMLSLYSLSAEELGAIEEVAPVGVASGERYPAAAIPSRPDRLFR